MADGNKPFLDVLTGKKPEHIPLWFMRQAGRYLPEYRDLRSKAGTFLDMAYNPDYACEVTMQPIRRYGMDAAIIFSDILVIPHALGQDLEFVQGEGPKLNPLRTRDDFSALCFDNFDEVLDPVYHALKNTRQSLSHEGFDKTALIGFCGAPWTVACYMVEGGGSRDFINVKSLSYSDPVGFSMLIDMLVEASARYLVKQVDAGAEALQIFDSWAGVLDASSFEKWVIEPTKKIIELVRIQHPNIPIIGFPRCAGSNYISYIQKTGVSAVGLDQTVDTQWAAKLLQPNLPVQGNLDPICLLAGGEKLIETARTVMDDLSSGDFVFNLGHGIHKDTPLEHVEALVKTVREYKR